MATTRREFLRAGMVTALAAAASTSAWRALAAQSGARKYQHPKDPAHLTELEMLHWPKLQVSGSVTTGKPYQLMIQIGQAIHPMLPEHHIEWVEVWAGDKRIERLEYSAWTWAKPVLTVTLVRVAPAEIKVRLSCNLHGLWENTIKA